jgi:hypothetical protein
VRVRAVVPLWTKFLLAVLALHGWRHVEA